MIRECSTWNQIAAAESRCFTWNTGYLPALLRRSKTAPCATISPPRTPRAGTVISLERYTRLLSRADLRRAVIASTIGRLPIGVTGLAILMLVQDTTGSYGKAGTVAAAYVAGLAFIAPILGRIIDRYGPRMALAVTSFAFPASLAGLVTAARLDTAEAAAYGCAVAAGAFFPPITVCLRTYLRQQLQDEAELAVAYSLESVLIEMIFILGPALVAVFTALASPAAAVVFAAASGCVGTLMFGRSPALSQWRIERREHAGVFGPLAGRGFLALLAVILGYATAFGLVEIGTTAYAAEIGQPAVAGVLLAVMSVGSALGGLVYGSRSWRLPLEKQFPRMLAVMGIGIAPLALIAAPGPFTAWCALAGVSMAPALIMQSMLVARLARPEHATEAFTWSSTALLAGVSLGLSLGGALLEIARSAAVFGSAAAIAIAAGALAPGLVRRRAAKTGEI